MSRRSGGVESIEPIGGKPLSAGYPHLFEGEKVVVATRLHVRVLFAPVAGFAFVAVLAALGLRLSRTTPFDRQVALTVVVVVSTMALRLAWRLLQWSRHRLVVTSSRILETSGIARRRTSYVPLKSISDVRWRRTFAGTVLGYGELTIIAPVGSRRFDRVPQPRHLAQVVLGLVSAGRGAGSVPAAALAPGRAEPTRPAALQEHERSPEPDRRGVGAQPPSAPLLDHRYRITSPLASGGMGRVFEGMDERLRRAVAIKLLREELLSDENFYERFRREALSAAGLSHPSIASIFDYGEQDGTPYIVMELVRGPDLARVLALDGPLEPRRAADIALEVLDALDLAHASGVVHRDVKPGNVLLCGWDRVKVTDFGIAKAAGASRLTSTGIVLGSAHYMSPEQVDGGAATSLSDIYAVGILLYEMLVGAPPFSGQSLLQVAEGHLAGHVPAPSHANPQAPPVLDELVLRATAVDPLRRFESAPAMAAPLREALETGLQQRTRQLPRPARLGARAQYDTPPLPL